MVEQRRGPGDGDDEAEVEEQLERGRGAVVLAPRRATRIGRRQVPVVTRRDGSGAMVTTGRYAPDMDAPDMEMA